MSGSPRIQGGNGYSSYTSPRNPSTDQPAGTLSETSSDARSVGDVRRQLVSSEEPDWEQRICLSGIPIVPVPAQSAPLLQQSEKEQKPGRRVRKASPAQILTRYWDNRAELNQFGSEATWLYKQLDSSAEGKVELPSNIILTGTDRTLGSAQTWQGIIRRWLLMSGAERADQLEKNLRHVILPDNDPRPGLRGQSGVLAATSIAPFTVLGPYVGKYCYGGDLAEEQRTYGSNVGRLRCGLFAGGCTAGSVWLRPWQCDGLH